MYDRQRALNDSVIQNGSQTFEKVCGILTHGVLNWFHMEDIFPEARIFLPFDSLEVINNSGEIIAIYHGSVSEVYTLLPYMIKPIARKSFMQIGLKNIDAANDTAAGEVIFHVKRLPPNVTIVTSTNTMR